jgi:hypothetical protein
MFLCWIAFRFGLCCRAKGETVDAGRKLTNEGGKRAPPTVRPRRGIAQKLGLGQIQREMRVSFRTLRAEGNFSP